MLRHLGLLKKYIVKRQLYRRNIQNPVWVSCMHTYKMLTHPHTYIYIYFFFFLFHFTKSDKEKKL